MAIGSVKIIDSDSAYDIYNYIMEMYHNEHSIEQIRDKIDHLESIYTFSELESEIYTTTYALAMWEIGGLSTELIQKIKNIVSKGASKLWNDIAPNAQKNRQKELNKLLLKIEQPNLKLKKRKNHKPVIDLIFLPEEVFAIHFDDGNYGVAALISTFQEHRVYYYVFAEILFHEKEKPTIEDVLQSKVYARMNVGFDSIKIVSHKKFLVTFESIDLLIKGLKIGFYCLLTMNKGKK
jgi:hypothetical protein